MGGRNSKQEGNQKKHSQLSAEQSQSTKDQQQVWKGIIQMIDRILQQLKESQQIRNEQQQTNETRSPQATDNNLQTNNNQHLPKRQQEQSYTFDINQLERYNYPLQITKFLKGIVDQTKSRLSQYSYSQHQNKFLQPQSQTKFPISYQKSNDQQKLQCLAYIISGMQHQLKNMRWNLNTQINKKHQYQLIYLNNININVYNVINKLRQTYFRYSIKLLQLQMYFITNKKGSVINSFERSQQSLSSFISFKSTHISYNNCNTHNQLNKDSKLQINPVRKINAQTFNNKDHQQQMTKRQQMIKQLDDIKQIINTSSNIHQFFQTLRQRYCWKKNITQDNKSQQLSSSSNRKNEVKPNNQQNRLKNTSKNLNVGTINKQYEQKMKQKQHVIQNISDELTYIKQKLTTKQQQSEERRKILAVQYEQLTSLKKKLSQQQRTKRLIQQSNQQLHSQNNRLNNQVNMKNKHIQCKQQEIRQLKEEKKKLQHQLQKTLSQKQRCIGRLQQQIKSMTNKQKQFNQIISQKQQQNKQLQTQFNNCKEEIDKLWKQFEKKGKTLHQLQNVKETYEIDINYLKQKNKQMQSQIKTLKSQIDTKHKQISTKNDEINQLSNINKQLQQSKQQLQTHLQKTLTQISKFFNGYILGIDNPKDTQWFVHNLQSHTNRKIHNTRLLYRLDVENPKDFHHYFDNRPNVVFICRLKNGQIIAAYSQPAFVSAQTNVNMRMGLMFGFMGRKVFTLKSQASNKQTPTIPRPITYDKNYINWGNSDISIKFRSYELYSSYSNTSCCYQIKGMPSSVMDLLQQKERDAEVVDYELYEVVFCQEYQTPLE